MPRTSLSRACVLTVPTLLLPAGCGSSATTSNAEDARINSIGS